MDKKDLTLTFALLVPCYNAADYVGIFLANISGLNKPFDEVIFYDDASTDHTVELLSQQGHRVIRGLENKGPGNARNQLAAACSSDWFHFHDIDDLLDPDYLVKKSARLNIYPHSDAVLCNVNWYDAQSGNLLLAWQYSNTGINENPLAYTIAHPIGGINGLYRKTKFMESGGFNTDIRIWEDADMHVKLAAAGAKFQVVEEDLSKSLRYPGSASSDQHSGWQTRLSLLDTYYLLFKDEDVRLQIGKQAQIAAVNLIMLGHIASAKNGLLLSEKCAVAVPDSKSMIWQILKWIVPANLRISLRLFQLKQAFLK